MGMISAANTTSAVIARVVARMASHETWWATSVNAKAAKMVEAKMISPFSANRIVPTRASRF
ncbi:hypothetical protein D3C72_2318330 [compost metagenome]